MNVTDEQLMQRIQQRDQAALSMLYDRYAPIVLGLLTRILGNRRTAEDVLQETFWRVWDKADSFDPKKGKAKTWLFSIARRIAIDTHRKLSVRPESAPDADARDEAVTVADSSDVATIVEAAMTSTIVHTALDALSTEQREVIEMAYFQGKTRREIAAEIDKPVGTVHTRARLGLKNLQSILANQGMGRA